jgi:hypothetical protein
MATCEICGKESDTVKRARIWLTNFGNRSQVERNVCRECRKAEKDGNL